MSGHYRTIVADPPWPYDGFATPKNWPHKQQRERGEGNYEIVIKEMPYETLSCDQIAQLQVTQWAASDCRLFLWATNRYLPSGLAITKSWGFEYKQLLVWDKRPNVTPFVGSVAPNTAEYLIVSTRGNPARLKMWPTAIVQSRKARSTHSEKPDVFLDLVETVSPGPYLELFARRQRLGWDTWGNEALEHVEIAS